MRDWLSDFGFLVFLALLIAVLSILTVAGVLPLGASGR
jgi:hypothetical protein